MGAPSKLTPERQKKIIDALRLGATYKLASQYAGVCYESFNNWMNAGETAKSGAHFQFFHAVKEAEGAAAVGWLAKIEKAASDGTWQAAAWKMERLHGDDYALTQKHRIGGDPENPTPIQTETKLTAKVVTYDEFSDRFARLFLGDGSDDASGVGDDAGTADDQ